MFFNNSRVYNWSVSDNPPIENLSRRSLLKVAIGAGATLLGLGILEAFVPKETAEQKKARDTLNNTLAPKNEWRVISKQDALKSAKLKKLYDELLENGGLSIRAEPKAPLKQRGETDIILAKLEPGETIVGIVWNGRNRTTQEENTPSWIAYQIKGGDSIGFASIDYLLPSNK